MFKSLCRKAKRLLKCVLQTILPYQFPCDQSCVDLFQSFLFCGLKLWFDLFNQNLVYQQIAPCRMWCHISKKLPGFATWRLRIRWPFCNSLQSFSVQCMSLFLFSSCSCLSLCCSSLRSFLALALRKTCPRWHCLPRVVSGVLGGLFASTSFTHCIRRR